MICWGSLFDRRKMRPERLSASKLFTALTQKSFNEKGKQWNDLA
jgi:hypothetical protein